MGEAEPPCDDYAIYYIARLFIMRYIQALVFALLLAVPFAATAQTTSNCVTLTSSLSRGMSGTEVRLLQLFLVSKGMLDAANVTGTFGPLTEAAVKKYQASQGIEQTGTVGPKTRAAIANCGTTTTTTTTTTTNNCPIVPQPATCANPVGVKLSGCTVGWQCSVSTLPAQTFSATPQSGTLPLSVKFSGVVTSANAGFCQGNFCAGTLDFGDGSLGAVPLPSQTGSVVWYDITHTYNAPGTFSAILYQGAKSISASTVGSPIGITVSGNAVTPTVQTSSGSLTANPSFGSAPLGVTFTAGNITNPTGYTIEFGDGTFGSLQQIGSTYGVTHTYSAGGAYTAKLRAPLPGGSPCQGTSCTVVALASVSVNGGSTAQPALAATPSSGFAPVQVLFGTNGAGSSYFGGVAIDFGDGATAVVCQAGVVCGQQNITHTYTQAGTYTVKLIGIGEGANSILRTTVVTVTSATAGPLKIAVTEPTGAVRKAESTKITWTITGTRPTSGSVIGISFVRSL
jgi:PKD repeat protein